MSYIRKSIKRNKDGTTRVYYAEVESIKIGNKIVQRHIRSLGKDPNNPTNFHLDKMEFSTLALRLMQGELTPNEVFDSLENMGHPHTRDTLEKIGIRYDFKKKTFSIYLFYQKKSKVSKPKNVKSVKKSSMCKKRKQE